MTKPIDDNESISQGWEAEVASEVSSFDRPNGNNDRAGVHGEARVPQPNRSQVVDKAQSADYQQSQSGLPMRLRPVAPNEPKEALVEAKNPPLEPGVRTAEQGRSCQPIQPAGDADTVRAELSAHTYRVDPSRPNHCPEAGCSLEYGHGGVCDCGPSEDPDVDRVLVGLRPGADDGDRARAESAAHRLGARHHNLRANAREEIAARAKERDEALAKLQEQIKANEELMAANQSLAVARDAELAACREELGFFYRGAKVCSRCRCQPAAFAMPNSGQWCVRCYKSTVDEPTVSERTAADVCQSGWCCARKSDHAAQGGHIAHEFVQLSDPPSPPATSGEAAK